MTDELTGTEGKDVGRTLPWHPFCLTAAFIIGYWLDTTVSPQAAVRPLLVALVAVVAVVAVAWVVTRRLQVAALATTVLILGIHAKRLLHLFNDLTGQMPLAVLAIWLCLVLGALALAVRVAIRRGGWTWDVATRRLNLGAALLLAATVGFGLLNGRLVGAVVADRAGDVGTPPIEPVEGREPDIYMILLDGYPRADVLNHFFKFDNSEFTSHLESQGFEVAERSHSDYLWTHVSLSSLLHMDYIEHIEPLQPVAEGRESLHPTIRRTVNRNPAFEFLREHGYQIVTTASGYEELALRGADRYIDTGGMNEFELKLLTSTFLSNALAVVTPDLASASHRDRITGTLEAIAAEAAVAGDAPKLVFGHIPAPHQPTVFGKDGAPLTVPMHEHFYSDSPHQQGVDQSEWVAMYRDQLDHLNRLLMRTVDGILESSDEEPVIILWSDHGSASSVDWVTTRVADADPAVVLERTGTLFAALTPDRSDVYPDDISPVNAFRLLFDAYFETELGLATPPQRGGHIEPVDAAVLAEP